MPGFLAFSFFSVCFTARRETALGASDLFLLASLPLYDVPLSSAVYYLVPDALRRRLVILFFLISEGGMVCFVNSSH